MRIEDLRLPIFDFSEGWKNGFQGLEKQPAILPVFGKTSFIIHQSSIYS